MNWKTRTEVLRLLQPIRDHGFDVDFENEAPEERDLMRRFYAADKGDLDNYRKHS
jgi:hypothetical protein